MKEGEITPDMIAARFENVVQSPKFNSEVLQEKYNFKMKIMRIEMPEGSGRLPKNINKNKRPRNFDEYVDQSLQIKKG